MDKGTAKKILEGLKSPHLMEFFDVDAFLKSSTFRELAQYHITRVRSHKNCTEYLYFINLFKKSKKYKPLLIWGCETLGLIVNIENNEIKLKNDSLYVHKKVGTLAFYMENKSIQGTYIGMISADKKLQKDLYKMAFSNSPENSYDDCMEHRVAGSFGSGKRK